MAITVDLTTGGGAAGFPTLGSTYTVRNKVTLPVSTAADHNVYNVLDIPAGTLVREVITRVVTAATGTSTITADVGVTGDAAAGFDATVDLKTEAVSVTAIGTDAYGAAGKYFSTADSIDLYIHLGGTYATAAVVELIANCTRV